MRVYAATTFCGCREQEIFLKSIILLAHNKIRLCLLEFCLSKLLQYEWLLVFTVCTVLHLHVTYIFWVSYVNV